MIQKTLAAYGISATSLAASLAVATDVLQFLTALIAFVSAAVGLWFLIRRRK